MESDPSKFVPVTNLGHELGVLFGFAALMVLCMVVYWIGWGVYQKRLQKVEDARAAELSKSALYTDDPPEK